MNITLADQQYFEGGGFDEEQECIHKIAMLIIQLRGERAQRTCAESEMIATDNLCYQLNMLDLHRVASRTAFASASYDRTHRK